MHVEVYIVGFSLIIAFTCTNRGVYLIQTWSQSLSTAAQDWSNRCDWKRGIAVNSSTPSDLGIGQSLYASKPPPINMTSAILYWFKQKVSYSYINDTCSVGQICLNYKQVFYTGLPDIQLLLCHRITHAQVCWRTCLLYLGQQSL